MKQSMILVGLLMFIGVLLATKPQTDWQKERIQGKVKTISHVYGAIVLETTNYNPQGNRESTVFGDDAYFEGETRYTYDDKERLVSSLAIDSNREFSTGTTNTYDAFGLLITKEQKDTFGSSIGKYEYNAKKQLMWIKTYTAFGDLLLAEEYLYDAAGNNIRVNNYEESMEIWAYTAFAYDKKNNLIEKREYELPTTEQLVAVYKYDTEGLLTEETRYHKGALDIRMSVSYDKYGNETEHKVYFAKKDQTNFTTFTYTYDKKGNWLTKEELRDGKLNDKQERKITYY